MNVSDLAKILGIDKKGDQKITFKKGNFSPEKIGVTPVFNRMFYNANFKQEITRINNDIKSAFKNLIKMGVHKNEIPLVSASLFNQLMVTIDRGNLSFIKNDSAPEFTRKELKKISDIQYKIYKVLFKIEEDLIDEQDTSIKGQEKNSQEFLANLKKLLDERDKKLREEMLKEFQSQMADFMEANGGGGSGFGFPMPSITDILSWYAGLKGAKYGFKGAKWLWNKFRQSRIVSKVKTLDEKLKQADKKAQEAKEKADKAKEKTDKAKTEADKAKEKADKAKTEADKKAQKEAEKAQKEAEKAQKEAEKAQKQAEKEFKQTQEDLEKANAESEKARAKAEQLGAKDKLPPKPEIKTGGTPAPRPTPPSNAAKKFPKLAKLFEKFKKALKAAGPALAKATVVLDIFILLPMKICEFWDLSMRPGKEGHLEFNFLERSIYCLTAGLTQWIEDHANIFVDIAGLVHLIIEFMANNFAEMAKDGSGTFEALANILGFLSWGVGKLIEKCIAPATKEIVNWIKKSVGAETGDRCGMIAVGIMRDSWEDIKSFCTGCVPNKETFALITGSNPVFNELERRGIYKFNAFGESELKYNTVHDIANKMTKAEIQAVLAHDDVDSSIKKNLKEALNYKIEKGISDRDVYKNSYVDGYLDSLITVLNNCDGRMEEQWLRMLQGSVDQTREFLLRFGWISLEYDTSDEFKVLWKGPFKDDDEAEGMFKYIFSRYKGQYKFLRVWHNPYDVLYFDVYGTLMSAGFTPVPYKDVLNPTNSKRHLKVLGYIDKQREFHEGLSCPNDEIFEAVKKQEKLAAIYNQNIIVQEPVQSVTEKMAKSDIEGVSGGGLPAHLAMTTGYSATSESYTEQDFNKDVGSGSSGSSGSGYSGGLPSHLSGTYNPNLVTETFNYSGSESVPNLSSQDYDRSDYTSIEAIRKAKVFKGTDGKWHSDNPFVDAIIQVESGGRADIVNSSTFATGLFQFMPKYAPAYFRRGNKHIPGYSYSPDDRKDPYKSLNAFKEFAIENVIGLKKRGIPISAFHLYMAHQQGLGGFSNLYRIVKGGSGALTEKAKEALKANSLVRGKDSNDPQLWYQNWLNFFNKKLGKSTGGIVAPSSSAPSGAPSYVKDSYSAGSSSPSDYSSSGSYGSSGSSGSNGSFSGQKAPDGVPSYVKNSYSAGSSSPSNFGSSGSSGSSGSVLGQKAPEGVPSYVKDSYDLMQKNTGNSMALAAQYATKHAKKQSIGYCAKYVANALEAAGLKFQRQPSAYMYHRNGILSKAGFGLVSKGMQGYTPEIGDVCVVDRFNKHVHGHICIWNGKNWVSDFVQQYSPSPYRDGPGPMYFYRYGGPDLVPNDSMLNEPYTDESYPSTNSESYSDPGMQSPETMNANAPQTPGVQSSGSSEKEGEAEGLFSFKLSDILG